MNNVLRLSYIQALVASLATLAVPAGASAQARLMGPRMGNPGMARPAGSAGMGQPSYSARMMAPGMQPMSAGGGRNSAMGYGSYGMAPYDDAQAYAATPGNTESQAYAAQAQPSPEEKSIRRLLTASGVPNDKGQLRWPIGLAILAAPEADELCERIDALFQETARQAADGSVSPALVETTRQAVQKLRRLLLKDKTERLGMPLAVYQESERFLNQLDRTEQLFRAGMGTLGGQRRGTESSSTSDSTGSHK